MSTGENIRLLRELHGISQKQLAEIAGVSDKAVSSWEQGLKEPRMGALQKIADHFGLQKSNLIEQGGLNISFDNSSLEGIDYALWGEVKDMTEAQKRDVYNFAMFIKNHLKGDL